MNKFLCFYTVYIGGSGQVSSVPSLEYDCYYFSNNVDLLKQATQAGWISIYRNIQTQSEIESCFKAKHVKILPHTYDIFKQYKYTCFTDSKLDVVNENKIKELINKYMIEKQNSMILRRHWFVSPNVYAEVAESFLQGRYREQKDLIYTYIKRQIASGLSEITEDHMACGFIIRDMYNPITELINNTWYEHIEQCGIQDQISFFFVKQLFIDCIVGIDDNVFKG